MILFVLACDGSTAPTYAPPPDTDETDETDTPHDTATTADTGLCEFDREDATLPALCEGHPMRASMTYSLASAALRVEVMRYNTAFYLSLTPDLGDDGHPDLVVAPGDQADDTFSVWAFDATQTGTLTTDDAWFSLHWSRLDYDYTDASATYIPNYFPEDGLAVQAGARPTTWYTFRAPLLPGAELDDADLTIIGRVDAWSDSGNPTRPLQSADLDGDGISEILSPTPLAGDRTWGGTYELAQGRVYIVPSGLTGTIHLDDMSDWVGGAGYADCESWDISHVEVMGDTNDDGYIDLVVSGFSTLPYFGGQNSSWIVEGPFRGGRDVTSAVARIDAASGYARIHKSGDFDGDGRPDLAITERSEVVDVGADGVLEEPTESVVAARVHYGPFAGVREASEGLGLLPTQRDGYTGVWMESADFDGDGFDDLLSVGNGSDLALTWAPFCETGGVTRGGVTFQPEPEFEVPSRGLTSGEDIDGDGRPELALKAAGTTIGEWPTAVYVVYSSTLPTGEER